MSKALSARLQNRNVSRNQPHRWRLHQFHDFALVMQIMITALEARRPLAECLDFFNMK
jgi:hypothetical protein